jgi:hypothetical protein
MTTFNVINAAFSLLLTLIVVYKITQFRDLANSIERFGLGLMGSGSFLTIPISLFRGDNPFEGWAVTLLRIGAIVFLFGRTLRDRRHKKRNDMQVRWHEEWKRSRG